MADQRDQAANITKVIGNTAHGATDADEPVKTGGEARSSLPTAVSSGQRAEHITDLFGRGLDGGPIPPEAQIWKSANYTGTQTGTTMWDPASGKKVALTYMAVSSYATTAARVIIWFGATADTTYSAGTDQLVWAGSFAPSANAKPGVVLPWGSAPVFAATADHELKITTDAGISLDVTMYGYEF